MKTIEKKDYHENGRIEFIGAVDEQRRYQREWKYYSPNGNLDDVNYYRNGWTFGQQKCL